MITRFYKFPQSKVCHLILLFGIFCYGGVFKIYAQSPEIEWQNTIGGNKEDVIYSCKKSLDDGFILGGTSKSGSSGDKSESNMGLSATTDYWIVKTDAAGNIEWENTIGGNKDDVLCDVIPTADGGYLVGGYSVSGIGGDKTEGRLGPPYYSDYWVIKLNASGEIIWQNTIGGIFDDHLISLIENADGTFYLGGESSSEAGIDKAEFSYANDIWIVKINSFGNIIWQSTISGLQGDYFQKMKATSDGGLIIGCYSYSDAGLDKSEDSYGSYDYWIIKLNAEGEIVWENTIGGSGIDYISDIIEKPEGGFIAVGGSSSNASGEKSSNTFGDFGYYDYWVINLDENGSLIWEKIYGGDGGDYARCVTALSDGNFLIGGNSSSQISGNKTTGTFEFTIDIWIIKIDSDGNIIWENSIGGDSHDYVLEMPVATDGGVLLGGYSYSSLSGDKTEENVGASDFADFWVIKNYPETCPVPAGIFADEISPSKATIHWDNIVAADNYQIWYRQTDVGPWIKKTTAINFKTLKSLMPETDYEYKIRVLCPDGSFGDFSEIYSFTTLPLRTDNNLITKYTVAPNPAGEKIIINGLLLAETHLIIGDVTGKKINELHLAKQDLITEVNLQNLPSGIYFITIIQNDRSQTIQFIHQ